MSLGYLLLLVVAGVLAGLTGSVAGLASLVSYPALLAAGLPAVSANVTNTVALVLSTVGASAASRPELRGQRVRLRRLAGLTAAGGVTGAVLLLSTSATVFAMVVPALVAGGSVILLAQPRLLRATRGGLAERGRVVAVAVFAVAVYGGYFGAGAGVLMLALFTLSVPESLPRLNALKNVVLGIANGLAAIGFALFGPVSWVAAAPLATGLLAGGALGPAVVRRLPREPLRIAIGIAGLALAAKLALAPA